MNHSNFEIVHVALTWRTGFVEAEWAQLEALRTADSTDARDRILLASVLPEAPETLLLNLIVSRFEEELRWGLLLTPSPEGDPPDGVTARSVEVGGATGVVELITSSLARHGNPEASYRVHLHFPKDKMRCRLLPREPHLLDAPFSALADGIEPVEIGYRLTGGVLGLSSVTLDSSHDNDYIGLDFVTSHTVDLRRGIWLPYVTQVAQQLAAKLFEVVDD